VVSSDPNSPSVTQIVFAPGTDGLPWSSTATLSVTYTTSSGEVRSQAGGRWQVFNSMAHNAPSSHQGSPRPVSFSHLVFMQSVDIDLPMCLFCCVVPPVKTACEKPVTMGDCFECVCVGVSIKPDCPSAINRRPPLVYAPVNPLSLCLRLRALSQQEHPPTLCPPPIAALTAYKITVVTNRTPPQLTALFDDLLSLAGAGMSQTLAAGSAGDYSASLLWAIHHFHAASHIIGRFSSSTYEAPPFAVIQVPMSSASSTTAVRTALSWCPRRGGSTVCRATISRPCGCRCM